MKKKTRVVLSSALSIAMCASLIAGSTYALFSSRTNVDVSIKASKVDLSAYVVEDSLKGYSTKWDDETFAYKQSPVTDLGREEGTFYAGGAYSYAEGVLSLDNISPGDAVEFNLKIENRSTIAIQYRVQLTVPTTVDGKEQGNIVKELQVSFNEEEPVTVGDESTFAQKWSAPLDAEAEITETPKVRVELPYELGDEYQGQSCLLHVGVYAVQLGTHVADAEGTYSIYTANDLRAVAALTQTLHPHTFEGETIALGANIDLSPDADGGASTLSIALADTPATIAATSSQAEFGFDKRYNGYEFQGTFNGNGYRISNFKNYLMPGGYENTIEQGQGAGLFNVLRDATVENLILSNVTIVVDSHWGVTAKAGYAGILAGKAYNSTIRNIVIENSSVKSTTNFDRKYYEAHHGHGGTRNAEPDYVGALVGEVFSATTVENVKITLNEDVGELIGNETRFYPGYAGSSDPNTHTPYEVAHTGNKLVGAGAPNVTYVGTSILVCIADGVKETMTFDKSTTAEGNIPTPFVSVPTGDALSALAQSVADGRDFDGVTVTLSDDIDLAGSSLVTGGEFKGTINGNGKTISGLDLENAGLLSGADVQNANLEFTTDTMNVSVNNPASALSEIATNYKNTTVTVEKDNASYTITYGEAGMTAAAFNGNEFEAEQELAENIAYSFDGVTFASLSGTANKAVTLANSTFGTAPAAGIMLASETDVLKVTLADGSVLSGNTFYGDVTLSGTAMLKGNNLNGTVSFGNGAKVLFTSDNKIKNDPVSYQEGWAGYTYVGWNVVLNEENKITSGTFVVGESGKEALTNLLAKDADILYYDVETDFLKNAAGQYIIDSADTLLKLGNYVCKQEVIPEIDVILTANINLAEVELPEWADDVKARGTIDGNGHIVYGVKPFMDGDYTKKVIYRTIFGHMDSSSTIKNVNFLFEFDAAWQKDFDNGIGASGNGVKPNFFKEVGTIENIVLVMKNQDGTKGLIYSSCGDSNKFDIGGMGSVPQEIWDRVKDVL